MAGQIRCSLFPMLEKKKQIADVSIKGKLKEQCNGEKMGTSVRCLSMCWYWPKFPDTHRSDDRYVIYNT